MGTPAVDSRPADADVGILFVHGIGQQRSGEALARSCDALAGWFKRWIEGAAERDLDPDRERDPEPVRVETATLAEAEGSPPHARLTTTIPRQAKSHRLLLAESWWAECFTPTSFGEMATWGFVVIPWGILQHFGKRATLAAERVLEAEQAGRHVAWELVRATAEILALTTAFLVVGPVLLLLVLGLFLLRLLPIPWFRDFALKQQRRLAATVGDSAVLLESPTQEAAIVGRVLRDLEWLEPRCAKLLVIAHSQGGAVAHEALRRRRSTKVGGLITFGSGLSLLDELKRGRTGLTGLIPYLGFVGGMSAGAWAVFAQPSWFLAATVRGLWLEVAPAVVALVVVSFIGALLHDYLFHAAVMRTRGKTEVNSQAAKRSGKRRIFVPYVGALVAAVVLAWAGLGFPQRLAAVGVGRHTWALALAVVLLLCVAGFQFDRQALEKDEPETLRRIMERSRTVRTTHRIFVTGFLAAALTVVATLPWSMILLPALMLGAALRHPAISPAIEDYVLSKRELAGNLCWKDFFASADPVSNGPFRDPLRRKELANRRYPSESVEVHNRGSLLVDHVKYWENADEFVTAVAGQISEAGEFDTELLDNDREWVGLAPARRRWRVACLRSARWVAGLFVFLMLFPSPWSARMADWAGPKLPEIARKLSDRGLLDKASADNLVGVLSSRERDLIARLGPALTAYIGYLVVLASWRWWDRSDTHRFFRRGLRSGRWAGYTRCPFPFVVFTLCFLAFVAAGSWIIVAAQVGRPAHLLAVAIALGLLVILTVPFRQWIAGGTCAGPVLVAFCRASGCDDSRRASLFERRAGELKREAEKLKELESDIGSRKYLDDQRRERYAPLGKRRLALASESVELAKACPSGPVRMHLRDMTKALLESDNTEFSANKRRKKLLEQLAGVPS